RRGPAEIFVSLWACGLLSLPVDDELTGIKACLFAGRHSVMCSRGANEIDVVVPAFSRPAMWHRQSQYAHYADRAGSLCARALHG
ncbi:MAG TPA: hypothetical protein VGT82_06365, partial [Ktedonobacteraceae bacterium]|nr:hypothetical protein [Ktedonobacteraceae bacterium]